jgi:Concanavalin A-like lectin/glucanases superfamily
MNYQQPATAEPLKIPENVSTGIRNLGTSIENIQSNVSDSLNQFSQKAEAGASASSQFLQSNTIVAKFAFLILVLVGFLLLMNLGISLIAYFTSPSKNPYIIRGMVDGNNPQVIPQDPTNANSIPILRSNNETTGAEFTWSTWIYLNDLGNDAKKYQHIFNKGDGNFNSIDNLTNINNAPGMYLYPATNSLHIVIDTVDPADTNTVVDISNVPIRKWVNVIMRLKNNTFDVYVNGAISNRLILQNVVKQNYNDVYVCQNGGFNGKLSNLRYYGYALNVFEINSIVYGGPNLTVSDKILKQSNYNYLSNLWYSGHV